MKLSLMVLSEGKAMGQTIPVTLQQFLIGRDKECQLRPASQMISKRHCAILVKGGKAFVRDFGSTNGTFVNDEPVKGERQLANEDQLKVGPLLFRVVLEVTPPVNKPTPPPAPPKSAGATDDDDVAAMLLSLQDEGGATPPPDRPVDSDGVPSGTTVHMVSPLAGEQPPAADGQPPEDKPADGKPPEKKEPPKKKEQGNTAAAAAAILEKYTRRQRS
jgi:pSer/pThr/pTyr-binding forkhead associated (FHA) protein